MTNIYLTEYNTKCYAVTFQNKCWIKVQKIEDVMFLVIKILYMKLILRKHF